MKAELVENGGFDVNIRLCFFSLLFFFYLLINFLHNCKSTIDNSDAGISTHPLLISQGSLDTASTRTQRALRHRRYQYLQLSNPRSSNPPVILQRYMLVKHCVSLIIKVNILII